MLEVHHGVAAGVVAGVVEVQAELAAGDQPERHRPAHVQRLGAPGAVTDTADGLDFDTALNQVAAELKART